MCRYITGFTTEQDVRLTLEAMEKKWWTWLSWEKPTGWDGWRVNSGNYGNFSLSYEDSFWWSVPPKEDTIDFRDAIRELTGSASVQPVTELPEYFTIPCNSNNKKNPLWEKYIDWLNKKYNVTNEWDSDSWFYGYHKNGDTYNHSYEMDWELEITLEKWDSIVNPTNVSSLPEYFYIERDLNDPRWMKFIDWINDTYWTSFIWESYLYYGWDGYKWQRSCWNDVSKFDHNPTLLTLDQWETITQWVSLNLQETVSNLPEYATESTVWHGDVSSKLTSKQLEEAIAELTTVDHTDPITGIKSPEPADLRLRTAAGASSGHWFSARVDGTSDPLRMAHDAAMYWTAVSYATPTSKNDSIYESYRQAGKAHNVRVNQWIDWQWIETRAIQWPAPAQVSIDEAPKKTSRYSSMLDLI